MEIFQPSWRGRCINSRVDSNGKKYTAMIGNHSLLYIPINALSNAVYKITLELCKESGNGEVYCNIYGNRNFDFPHSRVICETGNWTTFDVDVITKDFPKTVPMVFRLWRGKNSSGTILVRKIVVELKEGGEIDTNGKIISMEKGGPVPPNPMAIKQQLAHKDVKLPDKSDEKPPKMIKKPKKEKKDRKELREQKRKEKKNKPPKKIHPTRIDPATPEPKIIPVVIGEDNIKISVLISIYNRIDLFKRTLGTYVRQTLPKNEFELVIIDDQSDDDILGLCKEYAENYGLQFQYILFNNKKGAIEPISFVPALSNNIGLKHSRGHVVSITGPETLQKENNLEISWEMANKGYCVYGDVFRSSHEFTKKIKNFNFLKTEFDDLLDVTGSKDDVNVTKGWWWYYVSVCKEHVMNIRGVDERFMRGISGEDDDFALRMSYSGVPLLREHRIVGIHQDHSETDKKDVHAFRFDNNKWKKLRKANTNLLHEWIKHRNPVTNKDIDWGSEKAIIKKEIF